MKKFIILLIITINVFFVISAESNDKSLTLPGSATVSNPNLCEIMRSFGNYRPIAAFPFSIVSLANEGFEYISNNSGMGHVECVFCHAKMSLDDLDSLNDSNELKAKHKDLCPDCIRCRVTAKAGELFQPLIGQQQPNLAKRNDTNEQSTVGCANNGLSSAPNSAPNPASASTASNNSHIHQSLNHDSEYNKSNIVTNEAPSMMLPCNNNTAPSNTEEAAPSQPPTNPSPQNHETYTPTPQQNASVATSSQQSLPSNNTKATEPCTYETLGIITTRPKRSEYAQEIVRDQSFEAWPKDHYLKPHDLVLAGFFYKGRGDCVRCFYCAGGLRNWEEGDDIWVEHARWYPKCAFVRQQMGQSFIDTVQKLNKKMNKNTTIPYELVIYTMRKDGSQVPRRPGKNSEPLDEVQKILINQGFIEKDVRKAIQQINDKKEQVTLDVIHKELA
ncbi:MAG: hypothetical protein OXC48_04750, partial [Endozoicomonadaceae bacterium]|nr:hypothetical protein [Endozoicomonadaceae bacterium]